MAEICCRAVALPLNGNPLCQQPDREDLHLGAGSDKEAGRPVCRDSPQEIATNA